MNEPVVLDIAEFRGRYPQFPESLVADETLAAVFEVAAEFIGNPGSRNISYNTRKLLIYALMCHLLTLWHWGAQGQSGPLNSAKEGSVSAGFYVPAYGLRDYLNATPCGQTVFFFLAPYIYGGVQVTPCQPEPWG